MTPQDRFLADIWERAQYRLVREERALGASFTESYLAGWAYADEIVAIARSPDRPLVTLGLRSITT